MKRYTDYHVELFDKLMNSDSEGCVMLSIPHDGALIDILRLVAVENTRRHEDEKLVKLCEVAGVDRDIEVRIVPRMGICVDDDSQVGFYRDNMSFDELVAKVAKKTETHAVQTEQDDF